MKYYGTKLYDKTINCKLFGKNLLDKKRIRKQICEKNSQTDYQKETNTIIKKLILI